MPTLGVAQIAGYLKSNGIKCRVIDAGAEFLYGLFEGESYVYENVASCLKIFSDRYDNLEVTLDDFRTDFHWRDLARLKEYIEYEKVFSKELKKLSFLHESKENIDEDEYYGLSISYESQVIPAMLLAKIIKAEKPGAKICVGGSLLYNYENDFYKFFYISDIIDVLIVGSGEEVMRLIGLGKEDFLDNLSGINVKSVGERYIIDSRGMEFKPVIYEPDFSGVHFEYYPSIEKAFPYMIKERCYYGKCHFCNGDKVEGLRSIKNVERAFENIGKIADSTGIYNVYIVDAAVSPADLEKIAALPIEMPIRWIANGRFEKRLKDESLISKISEKGCTMLRFGLESASQRILNLMNKGTSVTDAEEIINLTAKYGIQNHVYLMFGYSGETKEDRKMTLDFLERNKKVISSYSVSLFQPIPGTQVYQKLLREIGEGEDVYERMIKLIYKDEHFYNEIYQDILKLNDILYGYARTNAEYYSANIFNTFGDDAVKEEKGKKISIQFSPENGL